MKKINIVIPAHNEEKNVPIMRERIAAVFTSLKDYTYEIIFVNDGSRDSTQQVLEDLSREFPEVKYIELSRNFGHQAALKAGLNNADGNAVISMDGDLQHPPELIPELIHEWENGYDMVYTIRRYNVNTSVTKRITSDFYYKVISLMSDFKFERGAGADFRLLDAKVVEEIKQNNESDLFIRGLVRWVGFRQKGIKFVAADRENGISQYTMNKMFRLALTGVTSFSVKPLYFAAYLGFFFSALSILYLPYVIFAFIRGTEISGWASLIMTVVFFGGLQLIMLGIIGIYLGKVFKQVKDRPLFIIRSKNF
ncbi:TPA: glycosyltransferase family 2 protein [Elizabethkingia meningoseptica]|uniref:glycosyltransferase family 2 protein n=1 Tax=Elizabethkingia meningoseptica TaxID=238 RepID=UPI0020124FC8|nr:glycosyltransferase family 2 protein [Elizabethkingia meningoseptica]EJK5327593.1 glycosyltransferase family 2 protein [Elizabethkingia meningoseptica]MCL1674984.1 glycosyltransferase family 2 protein [Elizabethkingia meningoseptica]MCL1685648.1 glycosyltransferase family 2 protein [Elizabethkingia meningoseptica]WBS74824.1 glycosyltransferase family 2 protein [Elizabethkingia meningoseptica]HAY3561757.1 glycosyltransferase family 2 protein [Elizabethkingia meningoseptica]